MASIAGIRGASLVVVAATAVVGAAAPCAGAREAPVVRPTQERVTLLASHKVVSPLYARPSWVRTIRRSRPITGGPTVLPDPSPRHRGGWR